MVMTGQPLDVRDGTADRSKLSFADRTPSESHWCTAEEQQTDERNHKTMERQFEAGGKLYSARTSAPTEESTDGIDGPYSPRKAIAAGREPNRQPLPYEVIECLYQPGSQGHVPRHGTFPWKPIPRCSRQSGMNSMTLRGQYCMSFSRTTG
jgi:hypothetical protein